MRTERGKMNKWIFLKKLMKEATVIVEVVDIRDIEGTRLPLAEKWAGSNRLIIIANKKDLLTNFDQAKIGKRIMPLSAKKGGKSDRKMLLDAIMKRSQSTPVKALLIGYPNVGKSSIINLLANRKATIVSPIAGTTKNTQWIKISEELRVTDYRGIFPDNEPKPELVRKGALNIQGDEEWYAHDIAEKILNNRELRKWIEKKYDMNLDDAENSEDVLITIAKRRNWYVKGGELNIKEAAKSLVRAMKDAPGM